MLPLPLSLPLLYVDSTAHCWSMPACPIPAPPGPLPPCHFGLLSQECCSSCCPLLQLTA
jgi:hypothetical protein